MIRKYFVFSTLLILHAIFFSVHANVGNEKFVEDLIFADKSMCHKSRKHDKKEVTEVKEKRLNFYVGANDGKICHDNLEKFMSNIKATGERIYPMMKNVFPDKIYFNWISSISLGYYAWENGQIDFEAIYPKVNARSSNTFLIFDGSSSLFAFLFNAYYGSSIQYIKITPYIGIGIGPTVFRLKKISGSPKNLISLNVPWLAYQLKLGVNYPIIPEIMSSLSYRYFSIPMPIIDNISIHSVEAGLTFNF